MQPCLYGVQVPKSNLQRRRAKEHLFHSSFCCLKIPVYEHMEAMWMQGLHVNISESRRGTAGAPGAAL